MNGYIKLSVLTIVAITCVLKTSGYWGFYGHRLINSVAVFTLPLELLPFYKTYYEAIVSQSINPDKRRYAVRSEGMRHYMDLDHWISDRDTALTYNLAKDVLTHSGIVWRRHHPGGHKTIATDLPVENCGEGWTDTLALHIEALLPQLIEEGHVEILNICDQMPCFCDPQPEIVVALEITDTFMRHGMLPYHLIRHQTWLETAFRKGKIASIISLSAELGHYIADAHVPLHTTKNYDGQLTGQRGIHAFWETRIPELFAEEQYDLVLPPAQIVNNMDSFYWDIVWDSHALVEKVLRDEKTLMQEVHLDRVWCFDKRNGIMSRLQCRQYAFMYQRKLDGMVEDQMRKAIWAIGSAWYTAWHNAGQPDLNVMMHEDLDSFVQISLTDTVDWGNNNRFVRPHE